MQTETLKTSEHTKFVTLYRKTSTGGLQYWSIRVIPQSDGSGLIVTEHGHLGTNSPQTAQELISEGKNLGKKNETSALVQVMLIPKKRLKRAKSMP
jgi:hypothetical protein